MVLKKIPFHLALQDHKALWLIAYYLNTSNSGNLANVTRKENNDKIKMFALHMTLNKRLARKLLSMLQTFLPIIMITLQSKNGEC